MINFGEYKPDLPPLSNDGLTRAEGVLPGQIGYNPVPKFNTITTTAIDARAQGFISVRDSTNVGVIYSYVGDATKLYSLVDDAWTDVSGATYTTAADERWEFTQWGDQVIGTNFSDVIQEITIGGANFAALGGTPPQARHLATVNNFLVVANTYDAVDGYQPQRIRWSAFNDITSWTVSPTTQADYQDLNNTGGWIQGVVGGEYGIIFQESIISRMSYIGSPIVFQFETIETGRGALAPGSIVPIGDNIAYMGYDGFFVFDGRQSIPIGRGKVDNSVLPLNGTGLLALDTNYLSRVNSAHFPNSQVICWSYPSINANPEGTNDVILFYNYSPIATSRWSVLRTNTTDAVAGTTNINHSMFATALTHGYTLDGLDAVNTSVDALPFSLDSRAWTGGQDALAIINTDLDLAYADPQSNSDYYDAYIETGEVQLQKGNRSLVTKLRPFIEDPDGLATTSVALSARDTQDVTASFSNTVAINASGFANVRSNGRFHKAYIKITGGFSNVTGLEILQSAKVGER